MHHLFRVGEVAKLFQISASTLRYYDEIGIFKPKHTDPDSRYRYYTVEQFIVLDTLIFLKKNGFSIQEIQQQFQQRTPENTRELFAAKLAETEQEIERLKKVSAKIEHKMATIEEGLSLRAQSSLKVQWFPRRAISYLYNDAPIDLKEDSESLYVQDLQKWFASGLGYEGLFTGDFGAVVDINSLFTEGTVKFGAVFELLYADKPSLNKSYLEEGTYACYPHHGNYETMKKSCLYMLGTLEEEGYQMIGPPLGIAMLDESVTQHKSDLLTWVQIPVSKTRENH
ncbi:MerR family transcriptional regulator [Marinicrinis sediminis]|uniref:MerR family transcriptional regulator n=1 Tax=Marinicrinis sediminis TaxID=1652465 RepID=A0ABW5RBT5_9BACL